ncbi:MAG: lipid-binding SYLF domain-containing protein [Candidatus Aminicenantales bacterium]|jgi:lipid-binding SYLF domain-containing protein
MTVKKRRTLGIALVLAIVLARPGLAPGSPAKNNAPANEIKRVEDATRVLGEMMKESDKGIPEKLLEKSAGIAIIPDVIKAAYIVGGRHGYGVFLVRGKDGVWSNPSFIGLTGGSIGWQIGVESADVILVFRTPRSIENITRGKFTLGADAGVSAGPLGRSAEASTDAELKAEIYAYSRSRGLYAGVSFQGASLYVDAKANQDFYGLKGVGPQTIFEGKVLQVPDVALKLRKALENFSRPAR